MTETKTTAEVAEVFRCSRRKITDTAARHGIGMDLGGRAGYRFTDADVNALREALRPAAVVVPRRRRRA